MTPRIPAGRELMPVFAVRPRHTPCRPPALSACAAAAALATVLGATPASAVPVPPPGVRGTAAHGSPAASATPRGPAAPTQPGHDSVQPLQSPQQAVEEAARVYREATRVGRRYERAKAATDRQRATVGRLTEKLERQEARYEELRAAVGAAAAGQYRTGGLLTGARVVLADSPEAFLSSSAHLARNNRAALQLAETADEARIELTGQQAAAKEALTELREKEKEQRELKRRIDVELERARKRAARLAERAAQQPAPAKSGRGGGTGKRGGTGKSAKTGKGGGSGQRAGGWVTPVGSYQLTAGYAATGALWSRGHTGQDFAVRTGTPVRAVGAGTVVKAGYAGPYGYQVVIRHADGFHTAYAHLSVLQTGVGQRVAAGEQIALSGSTGNSSGPHLHFEVRRGSANGPPVNPVAWLRSRGVRV
ncbi:peptidoglycan DD-metalloendopeptidase family protein [Streptomyces sp. JJ66]|uniref:M23 family metallopeptidase n=1 Tax=Streptomyces sp. JJ66 TaxID=2803843 RepID=UPI001C5A2F69|nr:M23 family metallopeptidase [Streptomyces sp. JJ66]MBW1602311.1 peptidoglycan DD-metalloendopeptidase family protein [Streptomyces sp. JJ66]